LLDTLEKITPDNVFQAAKIHVALIQKVLDSPERYILNVDENPFRLDMPTPPSFENFHINPPNDGPYAVGTPIVVWVDDDGYTQTEVLPSRRMVFDFGDGTPPVDSSLWSVHVYTAPGTYTITLSIESAHGDLITLSKTIEVE
jgi:hypothetical protein